MAIELASGEALASGRYVLQRRLGAGGMATVWKARDERLERPVAVKILSDAFAGDAAYAERFRREARLAAGLSHPHLVSVFDFADEAERPYLVMELVEGPTLAELLRSPGAHDHDPARLAHELLGALAHIHGAGIVHRDVKPSNVIIGGDGRSRLTDFGVAQHPDATRLTNTGNVVGTMRYLAPELLSGARASPRSDLYSCGVLLGEALGRHEDGALRDLIARLTDRDPDRRPAGAAQALAELDFERGGTRAEPVAVVTEPTAAPTGPTEPTAAPTGPTEPTSAPTGPRGSTAGLTGPREPTSAPTGPTAVGRQDFRRPARARARIALALLAALVVVTAVLVASSGSGSGGGSASRAGPAPASSAPLARQLDALERAGRALARR